MPITRITPNPALTKRHAKQLIQLKKRLDPIKREFKRMKREFIAELQSLGADEIETRIGSLKLICSTRESVDVKTLKREYPDVYHQLLHTVPVNSILFDFDGCEEEEED